MMSIVGFHLFHMSSFLFDLIGYVGLVELVGFRLFSETGTRHFEFIQPHHAVPFQSIYINTEKNTRRFFHF